MKRLAGAVERFACGSGGRSELGGRGDDGSGCAGLRQLDLGAGQAAQTERSGVRRPSALVGLGRRVVYEQRRRESQPGCSSATCGDWEALEWSVVSCVVEVLRGSGCAGRRQAGFAN